MGAGGNRNRLKREVRGEHRHAAPVDFRSPVWVVRLGSEEITAAREVRRHRLAIGSPPKNPNERTAGPALRRRPAIFDDQALLSLEARIEQPRPRFFLTADTNRRREK